MQITKTMRTVSLALAASSMAGCEIAAVNGVIADAYTSAETPESLGIAPSNYRGKSCLELAVERNSAQMQLAYTGDHQDYVRRNSQWTTSSVEQVERETGCLPGTTNQQAGAIEYVLKHPQDLEALKSQLPPGGLEYIQAGGKLPEPQHTAVIAMVNPTTTVAPLPTTSSQNVGARWGATTPEGLPQSSFDQWIAKETPEKYQERSCEYLQRSLVASQNMEASADNEVRAWGASKKSAVSTALASKTCPAPIPTTGGRMGAGIGPMDPVKAARLGMPLSGASIQKVLPGDPAEQAGIKFADVVVAVGDTVINDDIDLLIALSKISPGSIARLKVWRKGAYLTVPVVLATPL
ncbi:PDZ domain-containing protein [Pseudomonas siliginis]|uniref:PDZ domain-containing protein n=1 Tax=Pseudomonas siliginis TaxID=2842346 RepID=UPI00386514A7